jgi:hypothetical protein
VLVVNGPSRGEFDARYGGQGAAFASSNPPPDTHSDRRLMSRLGGEESDG